MRWLNRDILLIIIFLLRIAPAQAANCLELIELDDKQLEYDKQNNVPYLSPNERAQIRLRLVKGNYVNPDGGLADISGMKLMIVERDGSILADWANSRSRFHHSSLGAGRAVAMAGWIFIKNARLFSQGIKKLSLISLTFCRLIISKRFWMRLQT